MEVYCIVIIWVIIVKYLRCEYTTYNIPILNTRISSITNHNYVIIIFLNNICVEFLMNLLKLVFLEFLNIVKDVIQTSVLK